MIETKGYNLERLRVLVVDDMPFMRSILGSMLRAFGVREICEAGDGLEGFQKLAEFDADLLITDWVMPALHGIDLVELVRSEASPNPFLPIIMLTGYKDQERVVQARNAGIHLFIAKPISASLLYSRIAALIENPQPFVRTAGYFGPDRRTTPQPPPSAERRAGPIVRH